MRFSTISILALPLLAAAQQESPIDQIKAQAQYYFDLVSSYIPNPNKAHADEAVHAAAAKVGGRALHVLTLDNWKETILGSVQPASTTPEEWWVLMTGGNKTCFGHCGQVETSFNETAALFSVNPTAPHVGYINCENQPVLCNSWASGPPSLWIFHATARPAPVDVRIIGLNTTTTNVKTFTDLHSSKSWKERPIYQGYFHPFDGQLAQLGLDVPFGYVIWAFNVVPSWLFMIAISFISRSIMNKRINPPTAPRGGAPAPRAPVGAPPGDGVTY